MHVLALAALVTSCGASTRPVVTDPRGVRLLDTNNSNQTCAVMVNGELWCWGVAAFHDAFRTGEPTLVGPTSGAVELSVAQGSACVLDDEGAVRCAGSNDRGQLGDGSNGHPELRRIEGLPPVTQLARSSGPSCALTRDGSVWCWGVEATRAVGELSLWTLTQFAPTRMNLAERVVAIQPTTLGVCAAGESGATYCSNPVPGPMRLEWRALDALPRGGELLTGPYDVCRREGEVLTCANVASPTQGARRTNVPARLTDVRIAQDGFFAIGDGKLYFQQLDERDSRTPLGSPAQDRALAAFSQVPIDNVRSVVLGFMHACALDHQGHVWCWGDDSRRQLAQETTVNVVAPAVVEGSVGVIDLRSFYLNDFGGAAMVFGNTVRARVAATPPYEQAIAPDAPPFGPRTASTVELISWPSNQRYVGSWYNAVLTLGERGEINMHPAPAERAVFESAAPRFGNRQVVTSSDVVCRLTERFSVQCIRSVATNVVRDYPQLEGSTSITANGARVCGVLPSGSLRCVGLAPLGEPPTAEEERTADLTELTDVRALFSGDETTCAATGDGALYCWGLNSGHRFGRSEREHVARPTRVAAIAHARGVSLNRTHACAHTADGRAWCWGANFFSQCGAPPSPTVYPPVEVQGINDASAVFTTDDQACATRADGALWCWGHRFSNFGNLGAIARSREPHLVQLR